MTCRIRSQIECHRSGGSSFGLDLNHLSGARGTKAGMLSLIHSESQELSHSRASRKFRTFSSVRCQASAMGSVWVIWGATGSSSASMTSVITGVLAQPSLYRRRLSRSPIGSKWALASGSPWRKEDRVPPAKQAVVESESVSTCDKLKKAC